MKTTFRKFEKNRVKANPYCPCGKSNRDGKFSTEKGFAGQPVGHCHSCGDDFWDGDDSIVKPYEKDDYEVPDFCSAAIDDIRNHFDSEMESSFAKFLIKSFGETAAQNAIQMYYLGVLDSACNADLNSDVIFWQFNPDREVRAGKVMSYNEKGKRQGIPRWWHKIKGGSCQLQQCFFGEHLISELNKPIAIVESEKTAVIMSICNPAFIWLACGSSTNLQDNKCLTVSEYDVTLFPDQNQFNYWAEVAEDWDFEISRDCEIWFENGMIEKGDDIADYYLKLAEIVSAEVVKTDPDWSQEEYDSTFNMPEHYRSDIYTGRMPK